VKKKEAGGNVDYAPIENVNYRRDNNLAPSELYRAQNRFEKREWKILVMMCDLKTTSFLIRLCSMFANNMRCREERRLPANSVQTMFNR
jgi:hypothetical protein